MGCVNHSLYHNKKFEHVNWYIERIDKRFGDIVVVHSEKSGAFIAKKTTREAISSINAKKKTFEQAFSKIPEFLLHIIAYEESLNIIDCETKRVSKSADTIWAKIEVFDKDLNDDVNLRSLKNRRYIGEEIWNLIYFSVFVFAMLEDAGLEITTIKRSNFVIANKKLKYYCEELFRFNDTFSEEESMSQINNSTFKQQFLQRKTEFVLMLLTTVNLMHNINDMMESRFNSREDLCKYLLELSSEKIEDQIYIFIKERLMNNIGCYDSFRELRTYLIDIYDDFDIKFFDRSYVNAFKSKA